MSLIPLIVSTSRKKPVGPRTSDTPENGSNVTAVSFGTGGDTTDGNVAATDELVGDTPVVRDGACEVAMGCKPDVNAWTKKFGNSAIAIDKLFNESII
jgi:hypothetical protein